jgi:hypothetical protein
MADPSPAPKVSRFRPNPPPDDPSSAAVPDDGLCLNVFLLLSDRPGSGKVLLGRIDPSAPWDHIGGMHPGRIAQIGRRWMLPARQLFLFEAPDAAAHAIARDQLELPTAELAGPTVTSEAWQRPNPAGQGPHWDLSFLYRGVWPADRLVRAGPWLELTFHDPATLAPADVGRGHLDVLALAGYPVRT